MLCFMYDEVVLGHCLHEAPSSRSVVSFQAREFILLLLVPRLVLCCVLRIRVWVYILDANAFGSYEI
jgi:hypothetical protein